MDVGIRKHGIFFCDGEDYFVVFFFAEGVKIGEQGGLDCFDGHQRGNDWYLMDGVDSGGGVVGV